MNAYENYQESEILSAGPMKLIELLYRGALDSVRDARISLRNGDIDRRGKAVSKASEIVIELTASLDHAQGGELSRNLGELYDYLLRRLSEGHVTQMDTPFAEVEQLLGVLLDGWICCSTDTDAPLPSQLYGSALEGEREHIACVF